MSVAVPMAVTEATAVTATVAAFSSFRSVNGLEKRPRRSGACKVVWTDGQKVTSRVYGVEEEEPL